LSHLAAVSDDFGDSITPDVLQLLEGTGLRYGSVPAPEGHVDRRAECSMRTESAEIQEMANLVDCAERLVRLVQPDEDAPRYARVSVELEHPARGEARDETIRDTWEHVHPMDPVIAAIARRISS
jgi:hypothetical protein